MTSVAVIDLETTGLHWYGSDRIVELAAVIVRLDGQTVRELVTLVNPERDIGPTRLHGITTNDVLSAPRFRDLAGALVQFLDGTTALAGHNIAHFDHPFLAAEFRRLGYAFPSCHLLDTLQLAGGGSLESVCRGYGIPFPGTAHNALCDARATGKLLLELLADAPNATADLCQSHPISWPAIPLLPVRLLDRSDSRCNAAPPTYLARLLDRMPQPLPADEDDSAALAYTAHIDCVLEDRRITEDEGESLCQLADQLALSSTRIRELHWDYAVRLASAALADGNFTEMERRDLDRVCQLLGIPQHCIQDTLAEATQRLSHTDPHPVSATHPVDLTELRGKRVCFTGDSQCSIGGQHLTRATSTQLAVHHGLTVADSVTKKLDILIVADPDTQSGKAKKARQYGIRVIHEIVFWRALGEEVD